MTVVIRRRGRCAFTVDAHAIAAEHLSAAGASSGFHGSGLCGTTCGQVQCCVGFLYGSITVFRGIVSHAKAEHRMGRNHLAGSHGDDANAVLAAADYNFRSLLEWVALLLSLILAAINAANGHERRLKLA